MKIIVFSGTGNTLYCAKEMSKQLNNKSEVLLLNSDNYQNPVKSESVLLCFPVYAYTIPKLVRKFLKNTQIITNRMMILMTYGSNIGYVYSEIKKILSKKNIMIDFYSKIKCPENINSLFKNDKERNKEIYIQMDRQISIIAKETNNQISNTITKKPIITKPISSIFKLGESSWLLRKKINKNLCNSCGLCERICPSGAIKVDKYPKVQRKLCCQCQRCINYCPKKSITMFFQTNKSDRYQNKFIDVKEYLKK